MKVYQIPEGIPNIKDLFPALNFQTDGLKSWKIQAKDAEGNVIAETRENTYTLLCEDRIRLGFINQFGQMDGLDFIRADGEKEVKGETWQKSLQFPLDKRLGGAIRKNISSNEVYQVQTILYNEFKQEWVAEIADSPLAWVETILPNGFGEKTVKEFIPIVISDISFPILKSEGRFLYLVKIKYYMANSNITFR